MTANAGEGVPVAAPEVTAAGITGYETLSAVTEGRDHVGTIARRGDGAVCIGLRSQWWGTVPDTATARRWLRMLDAVARSAGDLDQAIAALVVLREEVTS